MGDKGHREIFWGDGNIYYVDWGGDFTCVYMSKVIYFYILKCAVYFLIISQLCIEGKMLEVGEKNNLIQKVMDL